jgi:hypothetical protein
MPIRKFDSLNANCVSRKSLNMLLLLRRTLALLYSRVHVSEYPAAQDLHFSAPLTYKRRIVVRFYFDVNSH